MSRQSTDGRRIEKVIGLVTEPEKQRIAELAAKAGLTVSQYVRQSALRDAGAAS